MTNLNTSTEAPNATETAIGFIPCYRLPFLSLFHADCMEIMKQYPDKYFDLAIVDPPYGISRDKKQNKNKGKWGFKEYHDTEWDNEAPNKEYWNELFRVSKNQIAWGANHYISKIPFDSSCWLVWDKVGEGFDFADCELAWTSFKTAVRRFTYARGNDRGFAPKCKGNDRIGLNIHPTQKPVSLYTWQIQKFATEGMKILDTHLGSGSIALAVDKANRLDKMNLHLTACEIDLDYVNASIKRISNYLQQTTINF